MAKLDEIDRLRFQNMVMRTTLLTRERQDLGAQLLAKYCPEAVDLKIVDEDGTFEPVMPRSLPATSPPTPKKGRAPKRR